MTPYIWIPERAVLAIHDQQIVEHGGPSGVRDMTVIQSALGRPQNLLAYGSPDVAHLAAAYAYGLTRNHGFVDGNKRIGFLVAVTFLDVNGYEFAESEEEVVRGIVGVASGEMSEVALGEWFRGKIARVD